MLESFPNKPRENSPFRALKTPLKGLPERPPTKIGPATPHRLARNDLQTILCRLIQRNREPRGD